MVRLFPAIVLLFLSPVLGEFLLGDFTVRELGFIAFFVPQYGGGALLVRELTRGAHRGWPTMLSLALAYGLIEEGLTTQSLFNPNYAGERLLDYGWIEQLGTSLHWTDFVLTLHVVWSIGSAIAVAEALSSERWSVPWLRTRGLLITIAIFLLGCALTIVSTHHTYPFTASIEQLAAIAILSAGVAAAAFLLFDGKRGRRPGRPPSVWLVGAVSFVLCSAFHYVYDHGQGDHLPAALTLTIMIGLEVTAIIALSIWSRMEGWSPLHPLAAASGAILTYGWVGLNRMMIQGETGLGVPTNVVDTVGQVLLLSGVLSLIALGASRLGRLIPGYR